MWLLEYYYLCASFICWCTFNYENGKYNPLHDIHIVKLELGKGTQGIKCTSHKSESIK